jgi:hypothetical protein
MQDMGATKIIIDLIESFVKAFNELKDSYIKCSFISRDCSILKALNRA